MDIGNTTSYAYAAEEPCWVTTYDTKMIILPEKC